MLIFKFGEVVPNFSSVTVLSAEYGHSFSSICKSNTKQNLKFAYIDWQSCNSSHELVLSSINILCSKFYWANFSSFECFSLFSIFSRWRLGIGIGVCDIVPIRQATGSWRVFLLSSGFLMTALERIFVLPGQWVSYWYLLLLSKVGPSSTPNPTGQPLLGILQTLQISLHFPSGH